MRKPERTDWASRPGIAGKRDIAHAITRLGIDAVAGDAGDDSAVVSDAVRVGDDCAAIQDGQGGYLLLACEGFQNEFVAAMPWFAGWCGIMVNLSDIAAMGGRATAVVDALWARSDATADPIIAGMKAASAAYGVPIVGGHTNLRTSAEQLSVAVLGRASALLTSFDAEPGDVLMAAIDLRGAFHDPHPFFDAASKAPPERLRADLELLPQIAEMGLSRAAKDISQGGVVGTAAMFCEGSGVGMRIDPLAVPRPKGIDLDRWLGAFPSFGYLLAVAPANVEAVAALFAARDIAAAAIGCVDASRRLTLGGAGRAETIFDFSREALIGCGPAGPAEARPTAMTDEEPA